MHDYGGHLDEREVKESPIQEITVSPTTNEIKLIGPVARTSFGDGRSGTIYSPNDFL